MVFTQGWSNSSVQKFKRLWCSHRAGQILGRNGPKFDLGFMGFKLLTGSINRSPKRTNIQPVENLSTICPVQCARSSHLNLFPRNFLLQKSTILSIFGQNALRSLIAVKHSILSESDDVNSSSAAWKNNTRKKSAISVQREVALFVVIRGQIILDADYLLVERNLARIVLCLVKMLLNCT